ncbi:hypothetical protein DL764_006351 [Monosporascus ibericus]|uniref:Uncharacterized protein n=1 Tax=Monosporascus ibericus TaxID=155417 RepID=A0A4Q4T5A8_9PEZI|nr:hypothetical protein DL764_006351 [Monosporascus ibericus]
MVTITHSAQLRPTREYTPIRSLILNLRRPTSLLRCWRTSTELGFLLGLEPQLFERCINKTYYSSVCPAQAVLKQWTKGDENAETPPSPRLRKILSVRQLRVARSRAGLSCVLRQLGRSPLLTTDAYEYSGVRMHASPLEAAKAVQRALADTLRLVAMRYLGPKSTYIVRCIFVHNYITSMFLEEQKNKLELTERIEQTRWCPCRP